jgi:arabinofuranosyltransferase
VSRQRAKVYQTSKQLGLLGLALVVAVGLFILRSHTLNSLGFPLDDAWIHQTYARNLATRGEWAFLPGHVSTGSTSPLWTLILAIGYGLTVHPIVFSYLLGCCLLLGIVWLIANQLPSDLRTRPALQVGLLLIVLFEWHLIWAALSGMETLLLGLHFLVILRGLERKWDPLILGGVAGLGIWIRPDAILSIVPIAWVFLFQHTTLRESALKAIKYGVGFVLLGFPYLLMNYSLGGEWWPSTYYAKQMEYAALREFNIVGRLLRMCLAPLVGVGLLLIPGMIVGLVEKVRSRRWDRMASFLWVVAFITVYAVRLPVDYQHGRYMIPVIPALFLLGYEGLLLTLRHERRSSLIRILSRSWILGMFLICFLFWIRGAEAYAKDVAVIETEMVAASKWISANTESDDLIAAHDIGALGYFAERRILDLAGLISPDVIPIIRNESALELLLDEQGADYLMTFPGWYPLLTEGRLIRYSTSGSVSPSIGGENMTVYRWP